jgi:hypothetical protein
MKTLHKITALAFMLGASGIATAQTNESVPTQRDNLTGTALTDDTYDNNRGNRGNWGLAGLLGLLGLMGLRRPQNDHQIRNTTTR